MNNARTNVSILDYEIGVQQNYDILDFISSLRKSDTEDNEPEIKEYQHSLFYPILSYCIEIINSNKDPNKMKFKVGLFGNDDKIYATVGRVMYDYFFMGETFKEDEFEIEFSSEQKNFNLKSIHHNCDQEKKDFMKFYNIGEELTTIKEIEELKKIIQMKKRVIVSKFLKGYSHQESVLKAFEFKIRGQYINLPNLIFKKKNDSGKSIEEIDQIYSLNLNSQELTIDDFDYFYYAKYQKGKEIEKKLYLNGKKMILKNNNLYFIEIKQSISGLNSDLEKLKDVKISLKEKKSKKSFNSSNYKREELTALGNTLLTFTIFNDLIKDITNKKNALCNLLFIVDSDFKEDMINIFEKCLQREINIIRDLNLSFNLYLIYTQPDLALKNFIKENWEKNNKLDKKDLELDKKNKELDEKNKELDEKNKELYEKNKELEKKNQELNDKNKIIEELYKISIEKEIENEIDKMHYKPIPIDEHINKFIHNIESNKNPIILIGSFEPINDNFTESSTSLEFIDKNKYKKEKPILIDYKTFNKNVPRNKNRNELYKKCILKKYEDNIIYLHQFNEIYCVVNLLFLKNINSLFSNEIMGKFDIEIFMLEEDNFLMHLKKNTNTKDDFQTLGISIVFITDKEIGMKKNKKAIGNLNNKDKEKKNNYSKKRNV